MVSDSDLGGPSGDHDGFVVRMRMKWDAVAVRDLFEDYEKVRDVGSVRRYRIHDHRPACVRAVVVGVPDHRHELRPVDDAHGVVMVGGPAVSARLAQ